jgi:protein-S-isoprenylcysteine O-methyltransferase Ste14
MTPGQAGRVLLAVLLLPAMVAGLVPWLLLRADPWRRQGHATLGTLLGCAGLAVLSGCVLDFWVAGRGTLAPWDPPRRLVAVGLYRFVRNPMYLGVLLTLAGWAGGTGSLVLAAYLVVVALGFHLRVVLHEEPWLARQFGADWKEYSAGVSRWWPRLRAWASTGTMAGDQQSSAGHEATNARDSGR